MQSTTSSAYKQRIETSRYINTSFSRSRPNSPFRKTPVEPLEREADVVHRSQSLGPNAPFNTFRLTFSPSQPRSTPVPRQFLALLPPLLKLIVQSAIILLQYIFLRENSRDRIRSKTPKIGPEEELESPTDKIKDIAVTAPHYDKVGEGEASFQVTVYKSC